MEVHSIQFHTFLTLTLDSNKWYTSWPRYFTPSTDWIGDWASLRVCFDALKMEKNICLTEIYGLFLGHPVSSTAFLQSKQMPDKYRISLHHIKVEVLPITGHEGPEGSRCIALLFLKPQRLVGVDGQRHALAALLPGKTWYPLYRRLGGPQGRSGRLRKISPPPEFDPRTIHPVASCYTD